MASEIAVSNVIDEWLRDEVRESNAGRNRILDDYQGFQNAYDNSQPDARNDDANKSVAHHSRFNQLMLLRREFGLGEGDDFFLGKIIHHALMFASGGFRRECLFLAGSQEEYEHLRFGSLDQTNGATSANILEVVTEALGEESEELSLNDVVTRSMAINNQILSRQVEAHVWLESKGISIDAVTESDLPVVVARERQKLAIGLAVSHIALTASEMATGMRGVPILEPKSISDVSGRPYYPFAE